MPKDTIFEEEVITNNVDTLTKLRKYHEENVVLWKNELKNSIDSSNEYARLMIALHLNFVDLLTHHIQLKNG